MPFSDLADRVAEVRERIAGAVARGGHGQQVTIVAVTKTYGPEAVAAAHDAGLHDVGENRVQEALSKMNGVTVPVRWHLIGHLQRNKAKAVDRFALVHSVDSGRLADAVAKVGDDRGSPINALMQVNVSGEDSKAEVLLMTVLMDGRSARKQDIPIEPFFDWDVLKKFTGPKWNEVKTYIKTNRLNVYRKADLLRALEYYQNLGN